MNPNIAQLARLPRGKPFESRLNRFAAEIRAWRSENVPYRKIAVSLAELGLSISAAAVHNYVRVRDLGRARRQYALPEWLDGAATLAKHRDEAVAPATVSPVLNVAPVPVPVTQKKFVYQAQPSKQTRLSDEQLKINDPLQ